jgi:riboflavin biosynthesis pyrimidine reductase
MAASPPAAGTASGSAGPGDIRHTHRLRALCHAVVVGAGTIRADDPLLTTRQVAGPVAGAGGAGRRAPPRRDYAVFRSGPPTLLVTAEDGPAAHGPPAGAEVRVPRDVEGGLDLPPLLRRARAADAHLRRGRRADVRASSPPAAWTGCT